MFSIALVSPRIPANVGNIARLCAATKSSLHLVRPFPFSLDDRHMKRAGLDYWEYVDLKIHNCLKEFEEFLKGKNFFLVTKFGQKQYTEITYQKDDLLIFGSEEEGLPEDFRKKNLERCLNIPMPQEKVRSLNLANSASIVLYEAIRQLPP